MTNLEKYRDQIIDVFLRQTEESNISCCEFLKNVREDEVTSKFCPNFPATLELPECEICFKESLRWLSGKAKFDWYALKKGDKLRMKDKDDGILLDFEVIAGVDSRVLWLRYEKANMNLKNRGFSASNFLDRLDKNALFLIDQLERDYTNFEVIAKNE